MAEFCRIFLTGVLDAQVTDETGLTGSYDFELQAEFPEGRTARDDASQTSEVVQQPFRESGWLAFHLGSYGLVRVGYSADRCDG